MGTSTADRMDRASAPIGAARPSGTPRWLHWLRAAGGAGPPSAQSRVVAELESELALLREENARLKVTQQRTRDRPVNERVRELLPPHGQLGRNGDESWELLTDCLLLRDGLIDACREIEQGMRATRTRLDELLPDGSRECEAAETLLRDDLESVA